MDKMGRRQESTAQSPPGWTFQAVEQLRLLQNFSLRIQTNLAIDANS